MKERFVILTSVPTPASTTLLLGRTRGAKTIRRPAGVKMQIRVDELNSGAAPRVSRTQIAAQAMPIRLIRPVKPKRKGRAGATAPAWGIAAVGADTSPFTGAGIVIAVLDTGIDASHPAFKGVRLVQRNFTEDRDGADVDGHGTHCAGTIFGRDFGGKRVGIARGVKKALIGKVIGDDGADTQVVAEAIQWAVREGANVISMSLGFDFPAYQVELADLGLPAELATSRALDGYRRNVLLFERLARSTEALAGVSGIGSIIVAAAGNESRTDTNPEFKIAVSPPAVSDGIISVAAVGESPDGFVVAPFSNTGALIAGPGVDIPSARLGGGVAIESGTSMAAPHVAGVAALWAEKLLEADALSSALLAGRLLGTASLSRLQSGVAPEDVGGGMVTAPSR